MSTITRSGFLAKKPELRHDKDGRAYAFARIIVTDRIRTEDGGWENGATIGYDVAVSGRQAESLVSVAESSGNIGVMFTGEYRVRLYKPEGKEPRPVHEVRNATIAVSLAGQDVTVSKRGDAPADDDRPF